MFLRRSGPFMGNTLDKWLVRREAIRLRKELGYAAVAELRSRMQEAVGAEQEHWALVAAEFMRQARQNVDNGPYNTL